jgi:hypothetical protein
VKLTYILTENDFLQNQLFIASKSKRVKQQKRKAWLLYSAALLLLGFLFYQSNNTILSIYFLTFGLLTLFFYPLRQKSHYKNHYQKSIADIYKNRFGLTANINFTDAHIETIDITGESKINLSEIESIIETSSYFYIKIKTGGYLIIPKQQLASIDNVRQELKVLSGKLSVDFLEDLKWSWK